jgi:DNA invertase Pin-like site-specific DNA recombinase
MVLAFCAYRKANHTIQLNRLDNIIKENTVMKKANIPDVWSAYGYLRLSKEDRKKDGRAIDESNSIKNQRDLILDFAGKNPDICVVKIEADDGFTGANFNREAFKEMISLIEKGDINCIICKDFSRLGREHIETIKYIEHYFAAKNVRFIAINDGYDSLKADMSDGTNSLLVPFKTIINEAFLEDISVKTKSHLEIRRRNGELGCNFVVYGYLKSKGKTLTVDEYAADIVRGIYESKMLGYGEQQIADLLNLNGVLSPSEYKKSLGIRYHTPFATNEKALWSANAVKRVLTNRVYIGYLEQGKRTKASYRMTKFYYKPQSDWSVHENNHEPIVSEWDFELIQELLKKDTRVAPGTENVNMFSGFVVCGDCGQPMTMKTVKKANGKQYVNFICSTHKKDGTCKNNNISAITLEKFVLLSIRQQITAVLSKSGVDGEFGADALQNRKKAAVETMIDKALQNVREYNDYLVKSYVHYVDGVITEAEYMMFKADFNRQITDAENYIANLRAELVRLSDGAKTLELVEQFKAHANITELNRRIVANLIKSVVVFDSKTIEVKFRYASGLDTEPSELNNHKRPLTLETEAVNG